MILKEINTHSSLGTALSLSLRGTGISHRDINDINSGNITSPTELMKTAHTANLSYEMASIFTQ